MTGLTTPPNPKELWPAVEESFGLTQAHNEGAKIEFFGVAPPPLTRWQKVKRFFLRRWWRFADRWWGLPR